MYRAGSNVPRSPIKAGALVGLFYVACALPLRLLLAEEDIDHAAAMISYTVAPVAIAASIGTVVRDLRLARKARLSRR